MRSCRLAMRAFRKRAGSGCWSWWVAVLQCCLSPTVWSKSGKCAVGWFGWSMDKLWCRGKRKKCVSSMYYKPMKKISLYIAYEQAKLVLYIPKSGALIPFNSNTTYGANIGKLSYYCELRVQYWVWKNVHQKANTRRLWTFLSRGNSSRYPSATIPLACWLGWP